MLTIQSTQFLHHKTDVEAVSIEVSRLIFFTEYEKELYLIFNKPKFT
jgi:hypothetical protein